MKQALALKQISARKETRPVADQPTYLANFRLREGPFQPDPDPRFLYLSQAHARAQAYMESAPTAGDPFVVITGEAGTGKSVLALAMRQELAGQALVMHCDAPPGTPRELLQLLLDQCGFLPFRGERDALFETLADYLKEQREAGRRALLLLDNAHAADAALLAALAELGGAATGDCLLHTALIGLPLLEQRLAAPEAAALAARARLRVQLAAFTAEQARAYIVHRLAIAGSQGREIFEPAAFAAVHRHAGGLPRQINALCDAALRAAAAAGHELVNADDVARAARELGWPEPSAPPATEAATEAATPAGGASAQHLAAQRGTGAAAAAVGRLRVQLAGQLVAEQDLYRGRTMIGRAADADLRIEDRTISRHHCQVICTDEHTVIQDLNSTNGIYVNDRRVRRHLLDDGEVFQLGAYQVAYSNLRSASGQGSARPNAMLESEGEATQH